MSEEAHTGPEQEAPRQELAAILTQAQQGDLRVLPRLRAALDADSALWRTYGDLAAQAEAALIKLAAGRNVLLGEALLRRLDALKAELAREGDSPLERLLIARVAATWVQLAYYDALMAQSATAGEARQRLIGRQQDAADRRHVAAVKALATVRKLLVRAPSPLEIATGTRERAGHHGGRFRAAVAGKVPVSN